jgi:hypothetical protein
MATANARYTASKYALIDSQTPSTPIQTTQSGNQTLTPTNALLVGGFVPDTEATMPFVTGGWLYVSLPAKDYPSFTHVVVLEHSVPFDSATWDNVDILSMPTVSGINEYTTLLRYSLTRNQILNLLSYGIGIYYRSSNNTRAVQGFTAMVRYETAEPIISPTVLTPDNIFVDNTSETVLSWGNDSSYGVTPTKADVQIKTATDVDYVTVATLTENVHSYTAPAGSFSNGENTWRVRLYNLSGVASDWSSPARIYTLGAPQQPALEVTTRTPRPEIRWQSDEQQAYQVEIDGVYASGTRFGTGKMWKAPFYLADGNYTVRVRVQNEYGFWSPWGTAALPITNVPGGTITLTAEGGIEAALSWTPGSFDYYLVYRDGVAIAKVTEPSYTDAASIGGVRYQVRGCYDNSDNYSLSEAVEVTVGTDKVRLYDMERGEWLHFLYDSSAHRSTGLSLSQDIQYVQLSGHTYPVAERSEFKSRALRITCVCADDAERQALRALLGHLTCCKTPEGNMTIGYPASISESSDDFFSTYSFTIEQIDRKEEIDLDS